MSPAPRRPVFDEQPRQHRAGVRGPLGNDVEFQIHLHAPYPLQAEILTSPAKRKVIVAGRRAGKTTLCSDGAIKRALAGDKVLEAAPVTRQTDAFWRMVKSALGEGISLGRIHKTETPRHIEFMKAMGGGSITCKTAWDANTLRGDYGDLLIFDEYSLMDPSAWYEVGAPMLLDRDGDAMFIFTPKLRNHAFTLLTQAMNDSSGDFAFWHFTSHDNPHLSKKALERMTRDMTEKAYRQEIMAEFLDTEGAVFRNVHECSRAPKNPSPAAHKDHKFVMGVDWGRVNDFTVISTFCATCRQELDFDRFNRIDYSFQRERLKVSCERWPPMRVLAEENAIGQPIIEQLASEGMPIEGYYMTNLTKVELINRLSLAFERESAQWLNVDIAKTELLAYEAKMTKGGHVTYGAPSGVCDDSVVARALAWWAAQLMAVPIAQCDYDDIPTYDRRSGRMNIFGARKWGA